MVKKINHLQLGQLVKLYYKQKDIKTNNKMPLIVYGTFGVGKSTIIRDKAIEIASEKGLTFVEWNKINRDEKDKVMSNPENYFCLIDIRLSEFDSSDVKGLPDFTTSNVMSEKGKTEDTIEWKIPLWAKFLCLPKSDGILFFDEINLATPLVISSTYKIIHDRVIGESKINENWLILSAGNKDEDRAYTHELASPVRDRAGEIELTEPSAESWTDWAINNGIDSRIIGFINWKPSNLHLVNFDDGQKFTTERGWARLNTLISGITDYSGLDLVSGTAIGEGIAREFVAFCKIKEAVKLEEIIKNPEILRTITEISIRYFVITALAEKYKDKKLDFEQVLRLSEVLDEMKCAEFVSLLWRLCVKYNPNRFRKDFTTKELNHPLRKKYHHYLVE